MLSCLLNLPGQLNLYLLVLEIEQLTVLIRSLMVPDNLRESQQNPPLNPLSRGYVGTQDRHHTIRFHIYKLQSRAHIWTRLHHYNAYNGQYYDVIAPWPFLGVAISTR
jgi:hypothetical protein